MEAEEGRGTHERARRNDAEGGLSPFSLQGRMMVVGRFQIVIQARSPVSGSLTLEFTGNRFGT